MPASGSGNTTVPGPSEDTSAPAARIPFLPSLTCVANEPQPHRVAEVALLDFDRFPELLLGRISDPAVYGPPPPEPRLLLFGPMRPGIPFSPSPLFGETLSRTQAILRRTRDGVTVECPGKAKSLLNGHVLSPDTRHLLQRGDVLQFAAHSSFLFSHVPASLPAMPGLVVGHEVGEPDASGGTGETYPQWDLRGQLVAAALIKRPVLLCGDTGTGKELAARELHRLWERPGPFIAINCAALPETLAESLLFGNAKNYPNVGAEERAGFVGAAQGGTLFLDEIGAMKPDVQTKLLRMMQSGEYTRLGEARPRLADVRLVAAMNEVASSLKKDLEPRFARVVELPPLSARKADVPLIARQFVLAMAASDPGLAARFVTLVEGRPHVRMAGSFVLGLVRSEYPGGVRDVQRLLLSAMAESQGNTIKLPSGMRPWRTPSLPPPAPSADDTDRNEVVDAEELLDGLRGPARADFVEALRRCRGNQSRAAQELGLSRDQFRRRLEKLKIDPKNP